MRVLSAAFFVLVSHFTISATRQPGDATITLDSLNDFISELVRRCSLSNSANTRQTSIPGMTLTPAANKLSEIIVDVLWTIDSELEDASIEEVRAPPAPVAATVSTLQTRVPTASDLRASDRKMLGELLGRLLVSFILIGVCIITEGAGRLGFSMLTIAENALKLVCSLESKHCFVNL